MSAFNITPAILSTGDVRIYEYGIRVDRDCVPALSEQIFKARRLYNTLVASIRDIVETMNAFVIGQAGPDAAALQARNDRLTDELAAARAANDEPAMKRIAEERRPLWHELGDALKGSRKANRGEIQERFLNRIGKRSTCDTYKLRCAAVADGLGWATANATLDAALIAFKKSLARGRAPRFAKGDDKDQDTLTLQFTAAGGVPAAALLAGTHSELDLTTDGCGPRKYGSFRFRLGAGATATAATGTWQYHRPIPAEASIGLARLVRRRVGKDVKWALQPMVKHPLPVPDGIHRQPLVSVHFGWAADIEGRRVAGIGVGADPGLATVLQLPPDVEAGLERSAALQSERDQARDAIVARLKSESWDAALLTPAAGSEEIDPDSAATKVAQAGERLRAIRRLPVHHVALRRLHTLCYALRDADALPLWLEAWRKEDRLRWQSATHIARRARNLRKDFYRTTASRLAQSYSAIVLEPLDLAKAARKVDEGTGEKTEFARKARSGRVVAALYEFESSIRWAAAKHGTALLEMTGGTAQACAHCGGAVAPDDQDSQLLRCGACGAEIDRKRNGAAVAWQAASDNLESLVEDFWRLSIDTKQAAKDKQQEKKTKMAEGRRATRAAE